MTADDRWDPPSPRAAELIRAATLQLLQEVDVLFAELDTAMLNYGARGAAEDARVVAAINASTRSNLARWASANIAEPGARVAANVSPETVEIGREIVRRGLDDNLLLNYHLGQNIAWQHWMRTVFSLSEDPAELREALEVSARSIFGFVDATVQAIQAEMAAEREALVSRTNTERLEVVNLLLERAPITIDRASRRLSYELRGRHTAAILWNDRIGRRETAEFEEAAAAIARAAGGGRPLTVVPNASTLWVWFRTASPPDPAALRDAAAQHSAVVRVAVGSTAEGLEGFRRSHGDALATQALMRRMPAEVQLATHADVRLVALAATDAEQAADFVAVTLGELVGADPVLRETLRVYIRCGFSAAAAARALFTHRNTVIGRLKRARALLPVTLEENGIEIGLALEIDRWLGVGAAPGL